MRKRRESLGELYELCDNSNGNCSSYAESTVLRNNRIHVSFADFGMSFKFFFRNCVLNYNCHGTSCKFV